MIQEKETSDTCPELAPILDKWLDIYPKASFAFPQTKDAWFIEATLASLFSSAAWLSGFPAVVETRAERPNRTHPKLDLLVELEGGVAAIETKVHYIPYQADAHRLVDQLHIAASEAQAVSHKQATRYFGMSFALLEHQEENLDSVLTATLSVARGHTPKLSGLAWVLLDQPDAVYRGCVVALQEVKRGAA